MTKRLTSSTSVTTYGDSYCEWHPLIRQHGFYDPIMAGSIDGTDKVPHDRAICRALSASYRSKGYMYGHNPEAVIFIGRLPYFTNKECIREALIDLSKYDSKSRHYRDRYDGRSRSRSPFSNHSLISKDWPKVHIVYDLISGYPCSYAFAYFASVKEAELVLHNWFQKTSISQRQKQVEHSGLDIPDGDKVILEPAFGMNLPGWRPRRLGGGLGGRKEAGQLRFGGVARPFRRPFSI